MRALCVFWIVVAGCKKQETTAAPAASSSAPAASACPSGMVFTPGGAFTMGTDSGEPIERPPHRVEVASFCVDETEVTVEAYATCSSCSPGARRSVHRYGHLHPREKKIGRNDPCPCGSGKKYKKCCLWKDQMAAKSKPAAPARPPEPPAPPAPRPASAPGPALPGRPGLGAPAGLGARPTKQAPPELTPDQRWWEDRYEEVQETDDPETWLAIAERCVREGPPPDAEFFLDPFDPALGLLGEEGRHAERLDLLARMDERFPEALRENEYQVGVYRLESLLAVYPAGSPERLAGARRLGVKAHKASDVGGLVAQLIWESDFVTLRALLDTGWPRIRSNEDLLAWAVERWGSWGIRAAVFERASRDPELAPDDPALLAEIAPYLVDLQEPIAPFLKRWVRVTKPGADPPAERKGLEGLGDKGKRGDEAVLQASNLATTVAARMRAKGGSLGAAWLLVNGLPSVLDDCAEELRGEKRKTPPSLASMLLPGANLFVGKLIERSERGFSPDLWTVAAVAFALPTWAALLVERGVATEAEARGWLPEVMDSLQRYLKAFARPPRFAKEQLAPFVEGEGRRLPG